MRAPAAFDSGFVYEGQTHCVRTKPPPIDVQLPSDTAAVPEQQTRELNPAHAAFFCPRVAVVQSPGKLAKAEGPTIPTLPGTQQWLPIQFPEVHCEEAEQGANNAKLVPD